MSQEWPLWPDFGTGDDTFPFDIVEGFQDQHDGLTGPGFENLWQPDSVIDDQSSLNLNNDFQTSFHADAIPQDTETDCIAGNDFSDLALGAWNFGGTSADWLDFPLSLPIDDSLERANMVATGQEYSHAGPAVDTCLSSIECTTLDVSPEISRMRSDLQSPAKCLTSDKKKSKRTKFPPAIRTMLEAQFIINPYPTDGEFTLLSGKSELPVLVIKRWFTNARSRKQASHCSKAFDAKHPSIKGDDIPHREFPRLIDHSDDSISRHRCSPAPSASSLERYLAAPMNEEAIPVAAIEAELEGSPTGFSPFIEHVDRLLEHQGSRATSAVAMARVTNSRQPSPIREYSACGSRSSASSNVSGASHNSLFSVTSRASRRGRKRWTRPPTPPSALRRRSSVSLFSRNDLVPPEYTEANSDAKTPYFCTSPECIQSFRNRYEWARHEEAVHHWPYKWICCLDLKTIMRLPHCFVCGEVDVLLGHLVGCLSQSCATKWEEDRAFMREDQLAQHMKRGHTSKISPKLPIPKILLSTWRIVNPSLRTSSLHCGFCGFVFATWEQRQNHVFDHLKDSVCKWAWWPGRLPVVPTTFSSIGYTCSACCTSFSSIEVASQEHAACATYSCRYLHDWHALFETTSSLHPSLYKIAVQCRLCTFNIYASGQDSVDLSQLQEHANNHNLRTCSQDIYTDKQKFQQHMRECHDATHWDGTNWHIMRFIEKEGGDHMVRTWMELQDCLFCGTRPSKAHGVCSVVTPMHRAEGAEKESEIQTLMSRMPPMKYTD